MLICGNKKGWYNNFQIWLTRWQRDDSKQHFKFKTSNYIMKPSEVCGAKGVCGQVSRLLLKNWLLLGSSTLKQTVPNSRYPENHLGNFLKIQMARPLSRPSESDSLSETHVPGDSNVQPGRGPLGGGLRLWTQLYLYMSSTT